MKLTDEEIIEYLWLDLPVRRKAWPKGVGLGSGDGGLRLISLNEHGWPDGVIIGNITLEDLKSDDWGL